MSVHKLDLKQIKEVLNKWTFTKHAEQRILERINGDNMNDCINILTTSILTTQFGYENTDGCYNIAVTDTTYIVVAIGKYSNTVITYKEPSHNKYTVRDKYQLALKGVLR